MSPKLLWEDLSMLRGFLPRNFIHVKVSVQA